MDSIVPSDTPQGKLTPETISIGFLTDPETQQVHYVFQSTNPERYYHRLFIRRDKGNASTPWIEDLRSRNLKPLMRIVEEVPYEQWQERECYWIDYYHTQGCHLTNTAPGGQAGGPSPEGRMKLSIMNTGKSRGPEFSAKMKEVMAAKKGVKRPPEVGQKVSAAKTGKKRKPFSEEWKRKIGEVNKGRVKTPEERAKIAASKRGKKASPATRAALSLGQKKRRAKKNFPPDSPTLWD